MALDSTLGWYQKKLAAYDKDHWERSVEQRIIRGLNNIPRKSAKLKPDLIDVDLVRGSMFPKAKPQQGLLSVTCRGIVRVLLLPLFVRWWRQQTSLFVTGLLLLIYIIQCISAALFYTMGPEDKQLDDISASEMLTPLVMMMILGVIHSQMTCTKTMEPSKASTTNNSKRRRVKRRSPLKSTRHASPSGRSSDPRTNSSAPSLVQDTSLASDITLTPGTLHSTQSLGDESRLTEDGQTSSFSDTATLLQNSMDSSSNNCSYSSDWVDDSRGNLKEVADYVAKLETQMDCATNTAECVLLSENLPKRSVEGNLLCQTTSSISNKEEVLQKLSECFNYRYNTEDDTWLEGVTNQPVTKFRAPSKDDILLKNCETSSNTANCTNEKSVLQGEANSHLSKASSLCPPVTFRRGISTDSSNAEQTSTSDIECPLPPQYRRLSDLEAKHDSGVQDVSSADIETDQVLSENEHAPVASATLPLRKRTGLQPMYLGNGSTIRRRNNIATHRSHTTSPSPGNGWNSSCESEGDSTPAPPTPVKDGPPQDPDWCATTNTECDNSYTTDTDVTDGEMREHDNSMEQLWSWDVPPATLYPLTGVSTVPSDKVSCTIWESGECHKANLSDLEISSWLIRRVTSMPASSEYLLLGLCMAATLSVLPVVCRFLLPSADIEFSIFSLLSLDFLLEAPAFLINTFPRENFWRQYFLWTAMLERLCLAGLFFFLLAVAERSFKQRFLCAKLFTHLTSSRRSRKSELPHFRLNKVRNIKTWLSVRSYLKKHGPQRSVDVIVSCTFLMTLVLVAFVCIQVVRDSDHFLDTLINWEVLGWCFALGIFLLRFMTLGAKTNQKYRNFSVLLTEQINLYLRMEQKPHKKENLMLANSVLKLAADLLKEIESPFKISGMSANPYLYNTTKLIILSAVSAVLTELLGFKLKLYKIKIK